MNDSINAASVLTLAYGAFDSTHVGHSWFAPTRQEAKPRAQKPAADMAAARSAIPVHRLRNMT